jgi:subtilisin family serine protease
MARNRTTFKGCSEHGTHTSSTAVGTKYGVASGAKLVAVQVLSCDGVGSDATILAGLDWSINHALAQRPWRPSVASLSLGGDFDFGNAFRHAVDQIMAQGMLIVVAAGNDAGDSCAESPADIAEANAKLAAMQPGKI